MNLGFKEEVFKAGFRPTMLVEEFETTLRAKLGLKAKYESARLSIGSSLAQPSNPPVVMSSEERGKPISGELLFGQELDLWIAALVVDGGLDENATIEDFRRLLEAHWNRGGRLLLDELSQVEEDETRLMVRLADHLPAVHSTFAPSSAASVAQEIRLFVGSDSTVYPSGDRVSFVLNGQATSPHIALMGKVGSGKTRTGLSIVRQIQSVSGVPMLFINPKGDFVEDGHLVGPFEDFTPKPELIEVGMHPIPLDFLPDPGVGSTSITQAAMQIRDSIALCCKSPGDIMTDALRSAIESVIRAGRSRSLQEIRSTYEQALFAKGKQMDSILSRLKEVTDLNVFEPTMSANEFFSRSWVLSLSSIKSEELRRLVVLLVLDSLKSHILSQADTPVPGGFRSLRHLLVIDEARRILEQKKYQSLVDLVRLGRSKGQVVVLLSQDPSDFDGKADDFMSQLSTIISFACSQSQRGLRSLQGPFGRKLQPAEFSDTHLPAGVALAKLPGVKDERIQCWSPEA